MRFEFYDLASYCEYEMFAATTMDWCGRDSEHCAQKWGDPGQSHPLPWINGLAGGDDSATKLVSIPYPNSAKGLASSPEASMLARVHSLFYSYPAELIARWCGITVVSARLYKSNRRKPSRTVLRLFSLHRDELVLGPEWKGWKIRGNTIVDPDGNSTTLGQLRAYWLVMQFAAEVSKQSPATREEFYSLLQRA